jgi:prolyl-tRNA synthetase
VKFATKEGQQEFVWATSWGVSTRLMGALVMTHSDDNGLVLPPSLAPTQLVIVPIYKGEEQLKLLDAHVKPLVDEFRRQGVSVKYDNRDTHKPGFKFNEYELKGVPLRIAVGERDLKEGTYELARRDTLTKETVNPADIYERVRVLLAEMQQALYDKALKHQLAHTVKVDDYASFKAQLEGDGGFVLAHWDGTAETEARIQEETKATIRCIPLDAQTEEGSCVYSGKPSSKRVLFAKAY